MHKDVQSSRPRSTATWPGRAQHTRKTRNNEKAARAPGKGEELTMPKDAVSITAFHRNFMRNKSHFLRGIL